MKHIVNMTIVYLASKMPAILAFRCKIPIKTMLTIPYFWAYVKRKWAFFHEQVAVTIRIPCGEPYINIPYIYVHMTVPNGTK